MDDDLEPITAEPVDMTLTLPKGNRQMRLSALAYRWLREARGLGAEDKLGVTLAAIKGRKNRYALVYDPDGLVVDGGNYYCSGVALRRLLDHPKGMVRIPLVANNEKGRLEFDLKAATISPRAGGAPAAVTASVAARSGAHSGTDESGPPASSPPPPSKAASMRAEVEAAKQRAATFAPCPQCGAEAAQQGTLYDYTVKPPRVSALVFSCPNGHRFETQPSDARHTMENVVVDGDDSDQAVTPGPAPKPPLRLIDEPDSDHPSLPPEDVNAIDAILDADAADDAENEVDPEWLAALHGETE